MSTISLNGRQFEFRIYTRPLSLGSNVKIQHYWMDISDFRSAKSTYRNCVSHWWEAMQSIGVHGDPDQQQIFVLARFFRYIAKTRSMQGVYNDAILSKVGNGPDKFSLPDEDRRRVLQVVEDQSIEGVQSELDRALEYKPLTDDQAGELMKLLKPWMADALAAMKAGDDELEKYLEGKSIEMERQRRREGNELGRLFSRELAYRSKVCGFTCYSNVWIDLIPWLEDHRQLDLVSERFLRFWNMQNEPVLDLQAGIARDIFNGQILALHPMAGFFMRDEASLAAAGEFFGTDDYERVFGLNPVGPTPQSYWKVIYALLYAANIYQLARRRAQDRRGSSH